MANYANLKAQLDANIFQNDQSAITGAIMNAQLKAMVDALGAGYQYMGVATPSTDPGTPDQKVFYLAGLPGTYTEFPDSSSNPIVVSSRGVVVLKFDSSWSADYVLQEDNSPIPGGDGAVTSGGAYDSMYLLNVKQMPSFKGLIQSNGTIDISSTTSSFKVINIKEGDNLKIDANLTGASIFVIAANINLSNNTFSPASGYSRQVLDATQTENMVVPADGKYLLLMEKVNGNDRTPYNIFINGSNIVDRNGLDLYPFADGRYYINGTLDSNNAFSFTTIAVKENDYLSLSLQDERGLSDDFGLVFFDGNGVFVAGYDVRSTNLVKVPKNAATAKLGLFKDAWKSASISILRLDYPIDTLLSTKKYSYLDGDISVSNGRIDFTTGEVEVNSSFRYAVIPIEYGQVITFTAFNSGLGGAYGIAFYDKNDEFIRGYPIANIIKERSFLAPEGSHHCKYGFYYTGWSDAKYSTFYIFKYGNLVNGAINQQVLTKTINYKGVSWNAVGDSVTENHLYMDSVKNIISLGYNNFGVSSCTIAVNNTYLQNQSIVERVCGLNGNTPIADADLWTIYGGLNDMIYSSPLGELAGFGSTFDVSTVYGALQAIVEHILNLKKEQRLILITPHHTVRDTLDETVYPTTIAKIRQAILDVGLYYAVPVLDLWKDCYVSQFNVQRQTFPTTRDGVHLNSFGGNLVGKVLTRKITEVMEYNDFNTFD